VSIVATGLENPRGLKFGPDAHLYVAAGGLGGTASTVGQCPQVPEVGPYTGGFTSRISRLDVRTGARETVVDHLPSSQTIPAPAPLVSGVADVAFVDGTLYAVEAGAGCSHGLAGTSNQVLRVNHNGTTTPVANLSQFVMAHPTANESPADFEPDGTWYSLVERGGLLYTVEPNHGEVDVVNPRSGAINRLVDVSASQGHIVPTALTLFHGGFLLGNLNTFSPGSMGHASVFELSHQGSLRLLRSGLTAVVGVAVRHNRVYALESFTGTDAPGPMPTGQIVRLNDAGGWDTIVKDLNFPTAMTLGPDDNLYVSNQGFGQPTNTDGQVLEVTLPRRDGD
jgi:hypothetical protein